MSQISNDVKSNVLSDSAELYLKASTGAAWSFGGSICTAIINFIVLAILARLLNPESFGLFALAVVVIQFFSELSELGLLPGIIQTKQVTEEKLSSCFWLSMLARGGLAAAVYFAAPLIGFTLRSEKLGVVVSILGLALIFDGATTVPLAVLQRALRFKEIIIAEIIAAAVSGFTAVLFAYHGLGVFSLVLGFIIQRLLKCLLFILFAAYRPRFTLRFKEIKGILDFGAKVTGERIVNFFAQRADYLLIGRYIGAASLGYYSLSSEVSTTPQKRFSMVISRVTLPVYCKVRDENERLASAYLKVVGHVASVTFPLLLCCAAVAPELVRVVFGEKWLPAVPLLRILCILGCLKSVGSLVGSLLYAKGRADIGFKWSFVMLTGTVIGVLIGMQWGIVGAAAGYSASFFILGPIIQAIALKLVEQGLLAYVRSLLPALFASTVAAGTSWIVDSIIMANNSDRALLALFCALASGAVVYVLLYFIFNKKNILELLDVGKTIFRTVSARS